jgi:hypothetical protein
MRAFLLGLAAVLLMASTVATANPEPEVDDKEFTGGNAIDRLAAAVRMLPKEYWPLKYMASTLEGRILLYRYWLFRTMYGRPSTPAASGELVLMQEPDPGSPPAESILDQMDEDDAPPVLVGEPGTWLQSLDAMGEIPKSPAESGPDQTKESPKPAVNQATPPKLVEAPR